MQIQISGCTSHCQGVSQVQVASQATTTVQSAGVAGEQASALKGNSAPQVTSTTTQIQVGCESACFGTTQTNPSTAAVTQLVLSELSSLVPPSDPTSPPPSPAAEQSTIDQFSYQMQAGGSGTQTQISVQTSATVQIAPAAAAAASGPQVIGETQQQTWQLQIGCLFYCVDTQQVQAATQSTTTVVILAGPSSSSDASTAATVVVSQQTIWQVQIGCLAWCWDSTQSQTASTQTTIPLGTGPPTEGGPVAGPGPPTAPAPAPASSAAASSPEPSPTAAPPTPKVGGSAVVGLWGAPRATGLAILTIRSLQSTVAPVSRPGGWSAVQATTTHPAFVSTGASAAGSPPATPHRRSSRTTSPTQGPETIATQPVMRAANRAGVPIITLLIAAAAAGLLTLFLRKAER